ncbi:TylF/MycF family methyltransferase [Amycolatopsis sp. FU40]|uniref:TylF/MycF/NovP-related O-methyltransferase n=1 Tax=Amycolatopsis sp. FU40 TaxID=2914159 RepID=UPI001F1ECE55|nr:TylF/MycF/NovP-related O-methyltransferase [Amycolatopsis sp. FU40]UKD57421.1 TylF/MycF family methyltransferase [Amycolatopsis sp. FU40]
MNAVLKSIVHQARVALLPAEARAVLRDRLTYLSPEKLTRLTGAVHEVAKRGVPGDLLEFGVALGGSSVLLARHATNERQFHGFDVFARIPEPTSAKDDAKSKERYQVIAAGESPGIGGDPYYGYRTDLYEQVCATFARYGRPVDEKRIFLHRGLFEETWPGYTRASVAFAHLDCDWYDPVRFCLNAVLPRLSPGATLILDDYHDYGGCRTAVDEFLQENSGAFAVDDGANLRLRFTAGS